MKNEGMKFTKCWDCKNFVGGCSWSKEGKPVEGWTAEHTHNSSYEGYKVIDCPLFKKDDDKLGETNDDGWFNLISAVGELIIYDLKVALIKHKMLKGPAQVVAKAKKEYDDFFREALDKDLRKRMFNQIVNETDDNIKILKELAKGKKREALTNKYGEIKARDSFRLWSKTKDCFND